MIACVTITGILLGAELGRADTSGWFVAGLVAIMLIQAGNFCHQLDAMKRKLAAR